MNLPTIEEIKKQFPGRVPDNVTSITFVEQKPDPNGIYREDSFIEWIGYWKGMAVGIKKFLFGSAGWVQIVLATVGIFTLFMSDPVQKPLAEFKDYAAQKIPYSEILPPRYVTFGSLPELPEEEKNWPRDVPLIFPQSVVTVSASGSWPGLS